MPANSGRQETAILEYVRDKKLSAQLYTFDKDIYREETGIAESYRWVHTVGDIFKTLPFVVPVGLNAAWFDLMGGFTHEVKLGLQRCLKTFTHGSLLWVTLQVHGARGVRKESETRKVYESWTSTPVGRVAITDSLLVEAGKETGRSLIATMPPYTYRRNTVTYAVYGYVISQY